MKTETTIFQLRLIPLDLHEQIRELAHKQGISMNTWLLRAAMKAVISDKLTNDLLDK